LIISNVPKRVRAVALNTEERSVPLDAIPARKTVAPDQLLIGGACRDAADGATMTSADPTTEADITTVAETSAADADAAIQAATRAFEDDAWGHVHNEERAKILLRMADLMDARADDFAIRDVMDMGMPYRDLRGGAR
jgi:aldehyde dehydrogenase (NAD+)